jgi:hypothetical protein
VALVPNPPTDMSNIKTERTRGEGHALAAPEKPLVFCMPCLKICIEMSEKAITAAPQEMPSQHAQGFASLVE